MKPLGSRWLLLLVMFLRSEEVEFLAQKILAGREWKLLCPHVLQDRTGSSAPAQEDAKDIPDAEDGN